jgi:hypothetical protein
MRRGGARRGVAWGTRRGWGWRAAAIGAVVGLLLGAVRPAAAYPVDPNWAPPRTVYIPETGQTIDRLFLDLWLSGGGAISWGNPITPEIEEADGHIVQYYEYARFEYWPEGDANGNIVALGNIGSELRPLAVPRRATTAGVGAKAKGWAAAVSTEQLAWMPFESAEDVDLDGGDPYRSSTYRFVEETGHGVWGGFRAFWEATGEAAYLGNPVTEEYELDGTSYQVFERGKLRWREGEDIVMEPVGDWLAERYGLDRDPVPQGDVPTYSPDLFVPPIAVPDPAAAPAPPTTWGAALVVSLSQQALWAFENGSVIRTTYVSTGTEKFRTPAGLYYVNSKVPVQDMAGVLGGEYYNVPQVPDVMYFTDRGHALHGTYWHTNFGVPMSHGCINLPLDVSAWMYQWAPVGMPLLIVP